MSQNSFDKFTNLYPVTKTLRFELKPVGNTQNMLLTNNIILKDESRKKSYENTKPYIDKLHRDFISESLGNAKLSGLAEYFEVYKGYVKSKKEIEMKKVIENKRKKLREDIVKLFNLTGKSWAEKKYVHLKLKKSDVEILFEEGVFSILKEEYGNESQTEVLDDKNNRISIFDGWKGFTGYFTKFFETRKNFYKSDGTSTAIATRIIDQNLDRFLDNLLSINSVKDKLDLSEVEEFFKLKADDVFNVDFYNSCLLQEGIDRYNEFIGGKTLETGEKKKGVNEIINKYRQDNPSTKIQFLKKLDKQILSQKEAFIEEIESEEKLLEVLSAFKVAVDNKVTLIKNLLGSFFTNTSNYNISGIFISKEAFNTISHKWTNETDLLAASLYEVLKKEKILSTSAKKKDGTYSFPDFIDLSQIKSSLLLIPAEVKVWKERYYEENIFKADVASTWDQFLVVFEYEFNSLFRRSQKNQNTNQFEDIGFDIYKTSFENLLSNFKVDKDTIISIKNFSDNVLHIYQMAKYFAIEKKRSWNTEYDYRLDKFYTDPDTGYLLFYENAFEEIVQIYNKIRNYLTRKPYSEDKWKLNFENPTLASGWDKNKERDNSAVILKKDGNFFLAIMKKGKNDIFLDKSVHNSNSSESYEKLVYKLFPDPSKMMPKVCFSKKGLEFFKPSPEIYAIYKNSEFKKGDTFSLRSMQKLISFYIDALSIYPGWKHYNFTEVKKAEEYNENIGEFFNDVAKTGYRIWFESISEDYIKSKNESGDLFLFQIYNQDFSKSSTGTKNLHTIYFNEVFSENNINKNYIIKLNGEAELFFRPKSIKSELQKRNFKRGIVNKRRYSEDKIFFHIPITLNRNSKAVFRFNTEINDFLAGNTNINIIGIDRGEKHLAYYSIINQKGEIIDSGSLNTINTTNYHDKLEEKAKDREQARKDWQSVEGIKDLKKGYISQVVRKIADLAIQHNAIIVMEDLNMRFKQIRGGIEKSVYQQLEKALIEKFNFLVNKNEKNPEVSGHVLKAYQLSAPFETFKDMGKQTGIIFYTQASYTSKIDPLTGWRPNIYLKYTSAEKAKSDIMKFMSIKFAGDKFEFTYNLKDFLNLKDFPNKTVWTVCSNVERFKWNRKGNNNKGDYIHYKDLTDEFDKLFTEAAITRGADILSQIKKIDEKRKENVKFFKDFIYFFNLICQIRNTQKDREGDDNDFILSPVKPFYDSRNSDNIGVTLPKNGDDNGAYNIARKGILIINKIKKFKEVNGTTNKMKWDDLYISQTEWDNFIQG